jgi:hypothetical protein
MEHQEHLDPQEIQDLKVNQEFLVQQVIQDQKGNKALLE